MYQIYQMSTDENLDMIATKFNTTKEILMQINGVASDRIAANNLIIVPRANELYFYYTVEKGDNLYRIAEKYGTTPELLYRINGIKMNDYIYPGQELIIPRENVTAYIVEENETLNQVARKLQTTASNLIAENTEIFLTPEQLIIYKKEVN